MRSYKVVNIFKKESTIKIGEAWAMYQDVGQCEAAEQQGVVEQGPVEKGPVALRF